MLVFYNIFMPRIEIVYIFVNSLIQSYPVTTFLRV